MRVSEIIPLWSAENSITIRLHQRILIFRPGAWPGMASEAGA